MSYEFGLHLKQCGIVSQLTPPGTPQLNGVSERRNHTLLDMVRSMMSLTDLPLSFWGYALETAAFTLNRAPPKSVETTPFELWFGKKIKFLRSGRGGEYLSYEFGLHLKQCGIVSQLTPPRTNKLTQQMNHQA